MPRGRQAHRAGQGVRIDIVDTKCHVFPMAKARSIPEATAGSVALAARRIASDPKGSINLRIETQTRQLIDDAAAVLGKTRTDFMIDSARALAIDVLLDQRLFVLDSVRYDAFVHALDHPPAPGPKLRALLRRTPAWSR
uniref:type II toxin-antitoxin system TacA family antitoxin n=1 Tax=Sphingomonas bacterium TaxID=1895847 RepID=UPI00341B3E6B